MQQVVQLGRRLVTTMAALNNLAGPAGEVVRQQKKALRTIVRRELRNFSPDAKRAEGALGGQADPSIHPPL
jgi:hypothetical protein